MKLLERVKSLDIHENLSFSFISIAVKIGDMQMNTKESMDLGELFVELSVLHEAQNWKMLQVINCLVSTII